MSQKYIAKLYFDEHVHESLMDIFRKQKFQCLKIKKTSEHDGKYGGRDEKDYIAEIRSEGALFVTADGKFVAYVRTHDVKHAGIILLPTGWEDSTLEFAASGLVGMIRGIIERNGIRAIHNRVFSIKDDGYHIIEGSKDRLEWSVDALERDVDEFMHKYPEFDKTL